MIILEAYYVTLLTYIAIYSIVTLGLNITMGYAGQINLGQAAFVGIGAYTSAILTKYYNISFWLALPLAGLSAMIIGILVGIISIRIKHDFLAITTIGLNFIVVSIFQYYDIFGATEGFPKIPKPEIFGIKITEFNFMILSYLIFIILIIFTRFFIEKTWVGAAFEAIKEDEETSYSIGIDVRKFKILAFSIGSMFAGIGGSLFAHFQSYIVYQDFEFIFSIMFLTMAIVGGLGTIYGSIVGTAIIILIPEIFRPLYEYRTIMYVLLLVILLKFMPKGIVGKGSFLDNYIKSKLR